VSNNHFKPLGFQMVVCSSRLSSGAERQMTSGCSTRAPVIRSRSERITVVVSDNFPLGKLFVPRICCTF